MIIDRNIVLGAILIFSTIFLFRLFCFRLNKKYRFLLKLFYISILLAISVYLYFLRIY